MKKSTLGIIIGVICTGLLVATIVATKPDSISQTTKTESANEQISSATVASHTTKDDCWMIIGNSVYDVTRYVQNHPGGDEILRGCGKDATALFNSRRDGSERVGSGSPHSSSASSTLEQFKIGELTN